MIICFTNEPTFSTGTTTVNVENLTTEQKLSLLEAMGIPVDNTTIQVDVLESNCGLISETEIEKKLVSLREFIERGI